MAEGIDFTSCRLIPGRAYNGANGKKIAVEYNGTLYMLKFPPSGRNKPTELSYTNSCFSEHIASSIFNLLGVRAHETMLGTFKVGGKDKIICACKDFTADGKRFFDFCSIKNTILESDSNGIGTELEDILDTIGKQQYVSPDVLDEEQNPKVRRILKKDMEMLDHVQAEMSTARQFLFILRCKGMKPEQIFQTANRTEKVISEQGFEVRRMKKADIKRFLAIYFGASMNGDQMPDVDGEQFYEVEDDEEEN